MLLNVIVSTESAYGVSKDGDIPWSCPEDLRLFKRSNDIGLELPLISLQVLFSF